MSRWKPGESGNRQGRPPGTTLAGKLREAVGKEFDDIAAAVIKAAKEGDMQAASLLLSRVAPPMKPIQEPVRIDLAGATLTERAGAIFDQVAAGNLSTADGKALLDGLAALAKLREVDELVARIEALEARQ
jgi:hypothetical protein